VLQVLDQYSIVAITDKNGIITYVNKEFCRISGYSENELLGKTHSILKSGHHPPKFYKDLWKTISSGHVWRSEIKNKAKNGSFYWVKTIIVPFLDHRGNPQEYYSIRTDITEQKRLQEELIDAREIMLRQERLRAIGELSARIAHDLRNPLSVMKATVEMINMRRDCTVDEKTKKDLARLDRAVSRMTHQINDILDFVKITELHLEENSLKDIIYSVIQNTSIPPNITMSMPQNDVLLLSDKRRLEVLIANMVSNAIDAIDEKTGIIRIRLDENSQSAVIEIEDSGSGISSDILPNIFEPLFTTKQKGTGLGLASCMNIVKSHNGKIDVTTNPTIFRIILPKIIS
jgi:PAS domain S-box-containing protein